MHLRCSRLALGLGMAVMGSITRSSAAQPASAHVATAAAWRVTRDPFAELWFQALASIGFGGAEPLAMYDQAFATRVRDATSRGRLAVQGTGFRRAFESDPAFEIMHFVPLYFVGRAPDVVFAALRDAARPASSRPAVGDSVAAATARTAMIVVSPLSSPGSRDALADFISAVGDEWRLRRAPVALAERVIDTTRLELVWRRDFVPALEPLFGATHVSGGVIIAVPGLGPEGRVVRRAGGDVLIAVGAVDSRDDMSPLFAAVRELTFSLVHLSDAGGDASTRAERESDIAATRAGAMVLDVVAPSLAARYRAVFRHAAGGGAPSFEEAFPLDAVRESRLRIDVLGALRSAQSK